MLSFRVRNHPSLSPVSYGDLGLHFRRISPGWQQWLERLVLIINENQVSTADPRSVEFIEEHMLGFLFGEGEAGAGDAPQGFRRSKK